MAKVTHLLGGPAAWSDEVAPPEGELTVLTQMPTAFFGTTLAGNLRDLQAKYAGVVDQATAVSVLGSGPAG